MGRLWMWHLRGWLRNFVQSQAATNLPAHEWWCSRDWHVWSGTRTRLSTKFLDSATGEVHGRWWLPVGDANRRRRCLPHPESVHCLRIRQHAVHSSFFIRWSELHPRRLQSWTQLNSPQFLHIRTDIYYAQVRKGVTCFSEVLHITDFVIRARYDFALTRKRCSEP